MRDTAAPDVHQDDPPAPQPEPPPPPAPAPEPAPAADPQPAPAAAAQEQTGARPARVTVGPVAAMSAETVTAVSAALFHTAGWAGVALGAAGLAGAGAGAVHRRRSSSSSGWRRTKTWSTTTSSGGRRPPPSFGRSSSAAGAGRKGRSSAGAGTAGGRSGGRGAGARAGSRMGGLPKRAGSPGSGKRRAGSSAWAPASSPMVRGARRAAHRTGGTARRAAHSTSRGLDHLTAATQRGRAAARAARTTAKDGGTARDAGKAARATLKNSRRPPVRGAWRRSLGETAWWVGGWGLNLLLRGLWWSRNQFQLYPAVTDGDEPARERIDSKADRPTNPSAGGHNGGSEMAKKGGGVPQFVHAADELAEAFRRYEPPPGPGGMVQMYSDMGMLPDALETIAGGFALFADRARSQLPLHPAVIDFIDELAKIQATMASVSAEIKPAIEKLHDKDLDRHRAPRQGEHMWDVG